MQALFENGDLCAGVGPRRFTVNLVCGDSERMWGGEEPATCQYQAWMTTPAACQESDLSKVGRGPLCQCIHVEYMYPQRECMLGSELVAAWASKPSFMWL